MHGDVRVELKRRTAKFERRSAQGNRSRRQNRNAGDLSRSLPAGLGELGVPIAVVAIVIALITPMPGVAAGFPDRRRHHAVRHRDDGGGLHPAAGRFQRLSHHPAAADAVPAGAEYLLRAADSAERQHRHIGRGTCDRGLRKLRGGRQLHHRRGDLPGADRDSVRGDQPWRGAHFGSDRALHPGRPARQADVDRLGSERRPDR